MKRTQTIVRIYRQVALLLLNVVVIAMCFNLVLWVAFAVKDGLGGAQNAVDDTYGRPDLTSVYPDLSRQEIEELLGETWPRQVIYEPFTQFREAPRQGKYVNVGLQGSCQTTRRLLHICRVFSDNIGSGRCECITSVEVSINQKLLRTGFGRDTFLTLADMRKERY